MSVVAITSSRTSPGATTLAAGLAIAWSHHCERALLIEADPAGGVLALRFELAPTPSLTTFGSDVRNAYQNDLVWSNTQDLRGAHCMPTPVDPRLARSWIERITPTLITELPRLGAPTVIDLGWVDEAGASASLAQAADTTLIVTRPDVAEVQALLFQIRRLQDAGANVALVTVGDTPNDPQEVAALAGIPLVAVLPDDPQVAAALAGAKFKPKRFRRSLLWRTISGLAQALFDDDLMFERAAGTNQPAVVADPTVAPVYTPAPADLVINTGRHSVDSSAPVQLDAVAAWAPGSLEQLTPEALADAPPLPAAALPVMKPHGNLHDIMPVPVLQDLTPNNAAPPVVVATHIPTSSPAIDTARSVDPGLYEVTRRMHPVPPVQAAFVLPTGMRQELNDDSAITIGRHRDCTIVLDDSQVSRRHVRLTRSSRGWHVADLGSRNGLDVNGRTCTDALLTAGDVLTIGRSRLVFEITGPAASDSEMECA